MASRHSHSLASARTPLTAMAALPMPTLQRPQALQQHSEGRSHGAGASRPLERRPGLCRRCGQAPLNTPPNPSAGAGLQTGPAAGYKPLAHALFCFFAHAILLSRLHPSHLSDFIDLTPMHPIPLQVRPPSYLPTYPRFPPACTPAAWHAAPHTALVCFGRRQPGGAQRALAYAPNAPGPSAPQTPLPCLPVRRPDLLLLLNSIQPACPISSPDLDVWSPAEPAFDFACPRTSPAVFGHCPCLSPRNFLLLLPCAPLVLDSSPPPPRTHNLPPFSEPDYLSRRPRAASHPLASL